VTSSPVPSSIFASVSFCATVNGETVVDLWGGIRNKQTGEPWERDTIINVWSTTKTMTFLTALLLARTAPVLVAPAMNPVLGSGTS